MSGMVVCSWTRRPLTSKVIVFHFPTCQTIVGVLDVESDNDERMRLQVIHLQGQVWCTRFKKTGFWILADVSGSQTSASTNDGVVDGDVPSQHRATA